jgi:hypothetical protein
LHKPNKCYKQMLVQTLGVALEEDHDVEVKQKEAEVEALLSHKKTKYHLPQLSIMEEPSGHELQEILDTENQRKLIPSLLNRMEVL